MSIINYLLILDALKEFLVKFYRKVQIYIIKFILVILEPPYSVFLRLCFYNIQDIYYLSIKRYRIKKDLMELEKVVFGLVLFCFRRSWRWFCVCMCLCVLIYTCNIYSKIFNLQYLPRSIIYQSIILHFTYSSKLIFTGFVYNN